MALAAAMARAFASASSASPGVYRYSIAAFLARRLFFASASSAGAATLAGLARHRLAPSGAPLSHVVHVAASGPARNHVRWMVRRSDNDSDSDDDDSSSGSSHVFPGLDYEHWLIVMDEAGGEGATKQQMIECYIQTLAKFVGSEEEAKKAIYSVCFDRYFGFGCKIDEETAKKLEGHTGVMFVIPDSYVDIKFKDYGAELFVYGKIVQRTPERQRRIEQPQYVRKDNQR